MKFIYNDQYNSCHLRRSSWVDEFVVGTHAGPLESRRDWMKRLGGMDGPGQVSAFRRIAY